MSLDQKQDAQPLTSISELVQYFRDAERAPQSLQIGLEHEKLVYDSAGRPLPYEGPHGIGALLDAMAVNGFTPFREAPGLPVIALVRDKLTISLEPGGQVELSGSPARTARQAHAENLRHLAELKSAAERIDARVVVLGYRPFDALGSMPWMPKTRYRVMRESLPERGRLALNMMLMTATGQVSLDWTSEADCVRKTIVTAKVAPLMVALYANSPLAEGKPTGYLSYRSRVWQEVDPLRCGYLPSWFDGSFSYQAYVNWALEAPLLFLRRRGEYLRPKLTFRQLLAQGFEGQPALYSDWVDHLSTLFPEVRLKKVMEVRGADCASADLTGALAALWRGILYDAQALSEAEALLPPLSFAEHLAFHETARKVGLQGQLHGRALADYARDFVEIAYRGLNRLDPDDAPLLEPLRALAATGRSPAEHVLRLWQQGQNPAKLLESCSP